METEPRIVFENTEPSDAVKQRVLNGLDELERLHGRITAARVSLNVPPREHRKGYLYRASIHLMLPGGREIAASNKPQPGSAADDMHAAVNGAFAVVRRRLQEEKRVFDGKARAADGYEEIGQVIRLYPEDGYGFIVTPSGHEVWFSQKKVKHNAFRSMQIGTRVYFEEELGDQGPRATMVRVAHDAVREG